MSKKKKILNVEKDIFANKIRKMIEGITSEKDFERKARSDMKKLSPEQKLGTILSDFGADAVILNDLGFTPDVLVEQFGFNEQGLKNVGYTPSKLKELGYDVTKYYKNLKIKK